MIKALNSLGVRQSKPIETINKCINNFLWYYTIYLNAKVWYWASNMLLKIHSDVLHMNELKAYSIAGEYF